MVTPGVNDNLSHGARSNRMGGRGTLSLSYHHEPSASFPSMTDQRITNLLISYCVCGGWLFRRL